MPKKNRSTVYHDNITASYSEVCKENKRLVEDYVQYCKANDKSPQTIYQYENWLKMFFSWNYENNDDKLFFDCRKRDFINYIGYLRDLDFSSNRIATLKSVLSAFSNALELIYDEDFPTFKNQLRGLEPIHIEKVREKTVLTSEQVETVLKKLIESDGVQEACYLALACSCGARKAELLQMKPEFFTEDTEVFDGYMYLTPLIRSKGRGKKGKRIQKYVIKEIFKPYFDLWMKEREEKGITCGTLFVKWNKGDKVWEEANTTTANNFAERISKEMNTEFYAHSARHYFCTLLRSMSLPDDVITQIFAWNDSSMIAIYDDTPAEERLKNFFSSLRNKDVKGE